MPTFNPILMGSYLLSFLIIFIIFFSVMFECHPFVLPFLPFPLKLSIFNCIMLKVDIPNTHFQCQFFLYSSCDCMLFILQKADIADDLLIVLNL